VIFVFFVVKRCLILKLAILQFITKLKTSSCFAANRNVTGSTLVVSTVGSSQLLLVTVAINSGLLNADPARHCHRRPIDLTSRADLVPIHTDPRPSQIGYALSISLPVCCFDGS
jgi:hypothetical protein